MNVLEPEENKVTIPLNCPPLETKATLSIYSDVPGDMLDPTEISRLLGLEPTQSQRKGSIKQNNNRPALTSFWLLSSAQAVRSTESDRHVDWLLDRISQSHGVIRKLKSRGYRIELTVTVKIGHWNTLSTLTPENLRRLGTFGIPLRIDIFDYQGWE